MYINNKTQLQLQTFYAGDACDAACFEIVPSKDRRSRSLCLSVCVWEGGDDGGVVGVEIVTEVFDTSWRHLQILVNRCWKLLSDFSKIVFERKNCNVRCHQITYLS